MTSCKIQSKPQAVYTMAHCSDRLTLLCEEKGVLEDDRAKCIWGSGPRGIANSVCVCVYVSRETGSEDEAQNGRGDPSGWVSTYGGKGVFASRETRSRDVTVRCIDRGSKVNRDRHILVHHFLGCSSQQIEMTAGRRVGGRVVAARHDRLSLRSRRESHARGRDAITQ